MKIAIYPENEIAQALSRNISEDHEVTLCTRQDEGLADYDYVMLAVRDALQSDEIRRKLECRGIASESILEYCYFEKDPAKSGAERLAEKDPRVTYDRYIIGMSHSYGGILEELLRGKVCKLSAPSMDLYYHRMVLQKMILDTARKESARQIIFELPYYIFNYDASLCRNIFVQRMNFYYFFSDYHHYGETEEGARRIQMFERMNGLSAQPVYRQYGQVVSDRQDISALHRQYRRLRDFLSRKEAHSWTRQELQDIADLKPHVWYKDHTATIEENAQIWQDIKDALKQYPQIDWKVVVFPFAPVFIENHREAVRKRRAEFYDMLQVPEEKVIDCFELYLDKPEFFADECHLNDRGRYAFSKVFDNMVGRR